MNAPSRPAGSPGALVTLADRWVDANAAERANFQSYLIELCQALGVEPPRPAGTGYEFEYSIAQTLPDGREAPGFIDCYKRGHFILEAKDEEEGRSREAMLRLAFGQAKARLSNLPDPAPPYLMVMDVGTTLIVWDRWDGGFGGFQAGRRIDLSRLADRDDDAALIRDIFEEPSRRDRRRIAAAVTTEIAGRLAELAGALEDSGLGAEQVARFLMRCVFSLFAEDVGLLEGEPFRELIGEALKAPAEFVPMAHSLWSAMDRGERFGLRKLLRFNGHFFANAEALPLTREQLALLYQAALADWQHVEPAIFGTLLVRALDPEERHRLGAEYTPPEFITRLIEPTILEPVQQRWKAVQLEALPLLESQKKKPTDREADRKSAVKLLTEFHGYLRGIQVLDPACGSGNFLYIALHALKRLELEVVRELARAERNPAVRLEEIGPWQFHGIEVQPWAREIAELTLWIGFHQFWRAHHAEQPGEPILRDTGTLEHRDAVLAWSGTRHDPSRDRPDPTPRVPHPVTGELVPDPAARLRYHVHEGAAPAPWPEADFIVGNPPYLGKGRQRELLGDGYVEALREAYGDLPDGIDFVMYWWHRAAEAVASGRTLRAGLITTNSITQSINRPIITLALEHGVRIAWAVADHPWVDEHGRADVRVAMTMMTKEPGEARLLRVDATGTPIAEERVPRLNADLSTYADVPTAAGQPLQSNLGISSTGFMLGGAGFVLEPAEAAELLAADPLHREIIRPYRDGKDLTARPKDRSVIDFGMRSEEEARAYPILFDLVRDRVKRQRDSNNRPSYRTYWWRFSEPRSKLRAALAGLSRYIATTETARHRYFTFLEAAIAPDHMVIAIALDDPYVLGVLSSLAHSTWALAAGGRQGVGNDPRYNKSLCLDPFPFPEPGTAARAEIGELALRIEAHRRAGMARDPAVTMNGMYAVIRKLRQSEALTPAERHLHEAAACGILRDLHDLLDAAVARAYGWTWPATREAMLGDLVRLHDERTRAEAAGEVR
jgi:hypothetical protein